MYVCVYAWMYVCMCMNVCMDGWMDVWMCVAQVSGCVVLSSVVLGLGGFGVPSLSHQLRLHIRTQT
jgi:hypothetical protein